MNYTLEIDIDLPVQRVIELFDDSENMKRWQPDLISFEAISGAPGQVGAESKLTYKMGSKEVVMTETITIRDLPEKFAGIYETENVWNLVENSFIELDNNKTRWICKNQFKCTGFVKLMSMLLPGMFKSQSCKYLTQFKIFAETQ